MSRFSWVTVSGHFALASDIPIVGSPQELGVADFNGDGTPRYRGGQIQGDSDAPMLSGLAMEHFPWFRYPNAGWARAVAVGDFNRDGKPDFVVVYNDERRFP